MTDAMFKELMAVVGMAKNEPTAWWPVIGRDRRPLKTREKLPAWDFKPGPPFHYAPGSACPTSRGRFPAQARKMVFVERILNAPSPESHTLGFQPEPLPRWLNRLAV